MERQMTERLDDMEVALQYFRVPHDGSAMLPQRTAADPTATA